MGNTAGFQSVPTRSEEELGLIEQVYHNDPNRTVVVIKPEDCLSKNDFDRLFVGLRRNTQVKELILTGLGLDDDDGLNLAKALKTSRIERLDVDRNNFSGRAISQIIAAVCKRGIVKELAIKYQRNRECSPQELEDIKENLKENKTLQHIFMDIPLQDQEAVKELFRAVPRRD